MKSERMIDRAKMHVRDVACEVLKLPAVERLFIFFAFQRRRVIRRRSEERLRRLGLYGDVVQNGPFKGMVYPDSAVWVSCRSAQKSLAFDESEANWDKVKIH